MLGSRFASRPSKRTEEHARQVEQDLAEFKRIVAQSETVLLTDESLWYEGAAKQKFWTALKETVESAGIDEIKIFVYLRRQDELALSYWKQQVKKVQKTPFEDFINLRIPSLSLDYRKALANIESVFGLDAISVRVYDRDTLIEHDICHDFCDMMGIEWSEDFQIPEAELNPNLSDTAALVKCWANGLAVYRKMSSNFLCIPALRYSAKYPSPKASAIMKRETYDTLRERYESDNEYVAQQYLNGEGGKLVNWPSFDEEDHAQSLDDIPQAIVQMFTEVLTRREQIIKQQSEQLAHLNEFTLLQQDIIDAQQAAIDELRSRMDKLESTKRR